MRINIPVPIFAPEIRELWYDVHRCMFTEVLSHGSVYFTVTEIRMGVTGGGELGLYLLDWLDRQYSTAWPKVIQTPPVSMYDRRLLLCA